MHFKKLLPYLLSILSGLLFVIAIESLTYIVGFVAFVPLLYSLYHTQKISKAILLSLTTGISSGSYIYYWLLEGVEIFSGGDISIGLLGYLFAIITVAIYLGVVGVLFFICKKNIKLTIPAGLVWIGAVGIWEVLFTWMYDFFPIIIPHISYTQFTNLYLIQHAEWGSMYVIASLTLLINFTFFHLIIQKNNSALWFSIACDAILHISGVGILKLFESRAKVSDWSIKVASIDPQFTFHDQWTEQTGTQMMNKLLNACKNVYKANPNLIVWTEGIISWPYNEEDDFIKTIKSINGDQSVQHIIGIKTEENGIQYNSAYAFDFKNNLVKRYDKHKLLLIAERPLNLFSKEFLLSQSSNYASGQIFNSISEINGGKISTIICHENLYPEYVSKFILSERPSLLVVIANNAWAMKGRLCTKAHFYLSAFRAVENRIPIYMNSNAGLTGYVDASGRVEETKNTIDIKPRYFSETTTFIQTHQIKIGLLFSSLTLLFSLFFYIFTMKKNNRI